MRDQRNALLAKKKFTHDSKTLQLFNVIHQLVVLPGSRPQVFQHLVMIVLTPEA